MMEDINVWEEYHKLQKERMDFIEQCTKDFDKGWYKKLSELRKLCGERGHRRGNFHSNGLGWSWYWCSQCGAAFEKVKDFDL